ncbi:MAG: hypothetical protein Q9178_007576 [Gyalolechia marmorata]
MGVCLSCVIGDDIERRHGRLRATHFSRIRKMGNSSSKYREEFRGFSIPPSTTPNPLLFANMYNYYNRDKPLYELHPMPNGMVGMTVSSFSFVLRTSGGYAVPDQRLMPTFGLPPALRHLTPYAGTAAATRGHGRNRSEGSRALTQSSRHHQSRSARKRAEPHTYELGDECCQQEFAGAMETVCKEQKELPMSTKRTMKEAGICVMGFDWVRQVYDGWRCEGGNHLVFDDQAAADRFIRDWLPKLLKEYGHQPGGP